MSYRFRPGVSPVVAALFAAGRITKADRVLDIGCGTGTDCIALRHWGLKHVVGLDSNEQWIRIADRRARAFGLDPDEIFHLGSITSEHPCFKAREFTVVIDSLVLNNLPPQAGPAYARQVARVLAPKGLLVLQLRADRHFTDLDPASIWLPPSFHEWFSLSDLVTTHLAENPPARARKGHATIGVSIGTRRARRRAQR